MEAPTNPLSALGGPSAPRCALYLRVSTAEQTTAGQMPDIQALVAARGYAVVETYEEQASAVKTRPAYERMMADAREGKFRVLVVWALDRFGRSLAGNVNALLALDKLGVTVVSVREPWLDTAGPVRELLVAIFSWVAQQERARLIERTKAGIAVARTSKESPWGRRSASAMVRDKTPAGLALLDETVEAWDRGGRTGGAKGLAAALGGCSPTTALKILKQWEDRQTPAVVERAAQENEMVALD